MLTTVTAPVTLSLRSEPQLKLDGTDGQFGDWRDDLIRDGYAIVKGAVPEENALKYADRMLALLESFGLGYDRNDKSTVHPDKLPVINEKGMLLNYGAAHEDFVWAIRSEPGVINAFEKVYATKDLIVSFDAVNYGFSNRANLPLNNPWPHQDQDPLKPGFRCLQGLVNLLPNGPHDGGLIICKGAHVLSEKFHEEMKDEPKIPAWTNEWFGYTENGMKWLETQGLEWVKVECGPGDLILCKSFSRPNRDSRAPHYNKAPTGEQDRLAVYTCYMPVADATNEDLIRKKDAFEAWLGTTHWPNARHVGTNIAMRDSRPDRITRTAPLNKPVLSDRAFKLTGIPYINA
ncbi:hypothetical protein GQ53DRAFT_851727 [Thozetella sp. PMI_491]|nr:hypothetical protein GQ53DRAFT_851727 [Thozetella sp. PMI_491]